MEWKKEAKADERNRESADMGMSAKLWCPDFYSFPPVSGKLTVSS